MRRHDAALREAAAAHFAIASRAKNGLGIPKFLRREPLLPNGIVYGNQVGGGRRWELGLGLCQPCASLAIL